MSTMNRWRLVLGRFAENRLSPALSAEQARMERALDYLYSREYQGRSVRNRSEAGSLDPSQITVPTWLAEVRELFPRETVEVIEKHALQRYGMDELLTDKEMLEKLEPNMDLLKTLLAFKGHMQGEVVHTARRIIRQVVEELKRKLETDVRRALTGHINRFRHSPQKIAQNFDWRGTVRRNLKHYDPRKRRLLLQDPKFFTANARFFPWHIILCVDQSGSMTDSVIHSAVMAGILAGLPSVRVRLVVFDTSVVDLTDQVGDPVEVLMSVQLGGGTDIAQALAYCEKKIEYPHRTILVLISDFCEGGPPRQLLVQSRRLAETGIRMLGLASLDQAAQPIYDREMASKLAETGMEIAALTPKHFAEWMAKVIRGR